MKDSHDFSLYSKTSAFDRERKLSKHLDGLYIQLDFETIL